MVILTILAGRTLSGDAESRSSAGKLGSVERGLGVQRKENDGDEGVTVVSSWKGKVA
jgi:uncharacterized protein YprB with RNaseH-like and TPR domain